MKERIAFISTTDNPFHPFDDFANWYKFDMEKGYNSCGILARVLVLVEDKNDVINENAYVEDAIDRIISNDITNIYIKLISEQTIED